MQFISTGFFFVRDRAFFRLCLRCLWNLYMVIRAHQWSHESWSLTGVGYWVPPPLLLPKWALACWLFFKICDYHYPVYSPQRSSVFKLLVFPKWCRCPLQRPLQISSSITLVSATRSAWNHFAHKIIIAGCIDDIDFVAPPLGVQEFVVIELPRSLFQFVVISCSVSFGDIAARVMMPLHNIHSVKVVSARAGMGPARRYFYMWGIKFGMVIQFEMRIVVVFFQRNSSGRT